MDTGTGIAIAGVWIFAGTACMSKTVSGFGMIFAIIIAGLVMVYLK